MKMGERFAATIEAARKLGINRIERGASDHAPIGFIVTGMAASYLKHVLADLGLAGQFPILTMGMSYPADAQLVAEFAQLCDHMIVVEGRRSFLEKTSATRPSRRFLTALPRTFLQGSAANSFPMVRKDPRHPRPQLLGPGAKIIPLIKSIDKIPRKAQRPAYRRILPPQRGQPSTAFGRKRNRSRTPTFCPGCPHRDSSAVLLEIRKNLADAAYMKRIHNRPAVDLVAHGDTGCYTVLIFAPTEQLMHNYSGMGLGAGTGSGIDPFINNKQLVFMGDGTFFHSGQIAISNSVKAGQDITYIILENGTTAMTGHQDHAGLDEDMFGNKHAIVDIYNTIRGMAVTAPIRLVKLSPADRDGYKKELERTILADGVKVIIADKECGITYHRRQASDERAIIKEKGHLPRKTHMNITPEVCETASSARSRPPAWFDHHRHRLWQEDRHRSHLVRE
jgi:indolepyruvate ferredoxin oxidoreductase